MDFFSLLQATEILSRWLFEHANAPYPTPYEKEKLMEDTHLSLIQINNWFVNARRRLLPGLVKVHTNSSLIISFLFDTDTSHFFPLFFFYRMTQRRS